MVLCRGASPPYPHWGLRPQTPANSAVCIKLFLEVNNSDSLIKKNLKLCKILKTQKNPKKPEKTKKNLKKPKKTKKNTITPSLHTLF